MTLDTFRRRDARRASPQGVAGAALGPRALRSEARAGSAAAKEGTAAGRAEADGEGRRVEPQRPGGGHGAVEDGHGAVEDGHGAVEERHGAVEERLPTLRSDPVGPLPQAPAEQGPVESGDGRADAASANGCPCAREEPRRPALVCSPTLEDLIQSQRSWEVAALAGGSDPSYDDSPLAAVHGFSVAAEGVGRVAWLEPVDLCGTLQHCLGLGRGEGVEEAHLVLRTIVRIGRDAKGRPFLSVYEDGDGGGKDDFRDEEREVDGDGRAELRRVRRAATSKPRVGVGLNGPAEVTLRGLFPKERQDPAKWARRIARRTCRMGAELVSISAETGEWVFRVPAF
jgi:hypothetical protein